MSALKTIERNDATGRTKEIFDELDRTLTRVPAMVRLMANSPAILDAYIHFNHALEQTTLSPKRRALITVAIAELTRCDYVLSIGIAIAKRQGVADDELQAARRGRSSDDRTARTLEFATDIVRLGGRVPQTRIHQLRREGFSDAEIVDIVGVVGLNLFRNY